MNNKYIILSNDIHMLGGGQIYVYRKVEFVENNGWEAYVFYYDNPRKSKIYIETLKRFKDNKVSYLDMPPYLYSKKKQRQILSMLLSRINYSEGDNIVIESNTIVASLWGELLAQMTNGNHLAYILSEAFGSINNDIYEFLYYKYNQNRLFGTNAHSLNLIFSNSKFKDIEPRFLIAYGGNGIDANYKKFPIDISKYDIKIGIFGRLDKHFVIPTVRELIKYFEKDLSKTYLLAVIGGTDKTNELKPFIEMFKKSKNAEFFCTGPIYPVPENWLKDLDAIIATAGSARVSASLDVPTISICVQNDKPLGILNYTTSSTRDKGENDYFEFSLEDYLNMIIKDKICLKSEKLRTTMSSNKNPQIIYEEFSRQLKLAYIKEEKHNYYSFDTFKFNIVEYIKRRIFKIYRLRMIWHFIKLKCFK